jgi:hypothetical protein
LAQKKAIGEIMANYDPPAPRQRRAERIEEARDIILVARAIVSVAAAASISELAVPDAAQYALEHVATILDNAADMLDTANLRKP